MTAKKYTKKEAIALMQAGRRCRPSRWPPGQWLKARDDAYVDERGEICTIDFVIWRCAEEGWTLLAEGPTRAELHRQLEDAEARLAEANANLAALAPVPTPEWKDCTQSEARDRLASGMRVHSAQWGKGLWIVLATEKSENYGRVVGEDGMLDRFSEQLFLPHLTDWQWAYPVEVGP